MKSCYRCQRLVVIVEAVSQNGYPKGYEAEAACTLLPVWTTIAMAGETDRYRAEHNAKAGADRHYCGFFEPNPEADEPRPTHAAS